EMLNYLATFEGVSNGGVADVMGVPANSVGQEITFFLKGPLNIFGIGQRYFSVRVKHLDQQAGYFSVVTLTGHPLAGYRFWRVTDVGEGFLKLETGAVEHPWRWIDYIKTLAGGNYAMFTMWEGMLRDADKFSGGKLLEPAYLIGGIWAPWHKEEFLRLMR